MGRAIRSNSPDTISHVMARGDNGEPVFRDDDDRRFFLALLKDTTRISDYRVHAFALMTNHLHLLLESSEFLLSRFMERLQGRYARRANWKHGRAGHVFRDRYLSKPVADRRYLMEVGRYIHMNPVKAGIIARPELTPWSSFRDYMNAAPTWITRESLLSPFQGSSGLSDFYSFTTARHHVESDAMGWPKDTPWYSDEQRLKAGLAVQDPEEILEKVADAFSIDVATLISSTHHPQLGRARAFAALALREQAGLAMARIAKELNLRTPAGASLAISRLRSRLAADDRLNELARSLGIERE